MDKVLEFSKNVILNKKGNNKIAFDATSGQGYDTYFLGNIFEKVYAFDIQEKAIELTKLKTKEFNNISYINDSFENYKQYIKGKLDCVMFNLGYLPNSDHTITTDAAILIKTLKEMIYSLNLKGLISIITYPGHPSGKIEDLLLNDFLKKLNQKEFNCVKYEFINQINLPPIAYLIERIKMDES